MNGLKPIAKKNKRHPGLTAASKALGVTYQHLRLVISGDRESRSLKRRYKEFKKYEAVFQNTGPATAPVRDSSPRTFPPEINKAFAEALADHYFSIFTKLGFKVVLVLFKAEKDSAIWAHPQLEIALGAELQNSGFGQHDSSHFHPGQQWHLFLASDLGKAVQLLKDSIEKRGLLPITSIYQVEKPDEYHVWYPPLSEGDQHISTP